MAHKVLYDIGNYFIDCLPFCNQFERPFYELCYNQILAMRRTIDHQDDFFNLYFKDKSPAEVMKWIEEESKKW